MPVAEPDNNLLPSLYGFKAGRPSNHHPRRYGGIVGTVDSIVFQRTTESREEFSNGYHVVSETEEVATVGSDLVVPI